MMNPPVVSVAMPAYNAERFIAASIEGILAQSFADFELIVVDDGSSDQTLEIARRYEAGDSRVRALTQPNRGVAVTRQRILEEARGEFMAVNDADDVSEPDRLELQVRYLREYRDILAVGSQMTVMDDAGLPISITKYPLTHEEIDQMHLIVGASQIGHSSSMMRTAAARAVGGYREGFIAAEDLDLWLRLAERGRLANVPQAMVRYRSHDQSLTRVTAGRSQRELICSAVAEARERRGLPVGAEPSWRPDPPTAAVATRTLARQALHAGNYLGALRLAARAVGLAPASPGAWATWLLAIGGPMGRWSLAAWKVARERSQKVAALARLAR